MTAQIATLIAAIIAAIVGLANLLVLVSKGHADTTERWIADVRDLLAECALQIAKANNAHYKAHAKRAGEEVYADFDVSIDEVDNPCKELLFKADLYLDENVKIQNEVREKLYESYGFAWRTFLYSPDTPLKDLSDGIVSRQEDFVSAASQMLSEKSRVARLQRAGAFWIS